MDPINYILDVKNPIEEAIKGYTMGRNDIAQRQELQIQQQNATMAQKAFEDQQTALAEQRAAAEQQKAQAAAFQTDLMGLKQAADAGTLTPDLVNQFSISHATNFDEFKTAFTAISDAQKASQTSFGINLATSLLGASPEVGVKLLNERIAAAEASGNTDEVAKLKANLAVVEMDPHAAGVSMLATLSATGAIDSATMKGILDATQPNQAAADSTTVQSSNNLGGIAIVLTMKDGSVQIKDARTNQIVTGPAADTLLAEANTLQANMTGSREAAGTAARLTTTADLGAAAAAATAGGASAVKLGTDAYLKIQPIRSNIANLDKAINLIEVEGANTGVIQSKLPNWNAATIELNNLQSQLGLDVVGAVTFGALSQGELGLALQVALPTDLDGPDLANWLRSKKAAQEKLADYFTEQSKFFSRGYPPGQWFDFVDSGEKDLNKWMRANRPNYGAPTEGQQTPAATETATAPEAPTAATPAGETEELAFLSAMKDKYARGETFTQAELNRLNVIAAKGK